MSNEWLKLRARFQDVVGRQGVQKVADVIPADRRTVYRLVRGDTQNPSRAVLAGIRKVVEDDGNDGIPRKP